MKRYASVTFDAALVASDREDAVRSLGSAVTLATSWSEAGGRAYALVELRDGMRPPSVRGLRIDEPPLVVLRIRPRSGDRVGALAGALEGGGRPRGVVETRPEPGALVVAFDGRTTSLALLLAVVDAILADEPGRTVEPLLPLDDATVAEFAGLLLDEPRLDATRLIETYLEPLLAGMPL